MHRNCPANFGGRKKIDGKIAEETKQDIYNLIGIEVTRQLKRVEKVTENREKMLEARMDERIESVHREFQHGLDVHGTQPVLQRVQLLESETKTLVQALGGTQAGFREWATRVATQADVQHGLAQLKKEIRLEIFKESTKGDVETGDRAVKMVEKMMAAQEEKFLVKMNAVEKSWEKDQKALQKQIDDQQRTIWELRQENSNLKEKIVPPRSIPEDVITKKDLQRELDRMVFFTHPPPSTLVPPIDLSRLGNPTLVVESPRPREGGIINPVSKKI